jgi:F-type H+-transporting ATPase subunit delta
MLTGSLARRYAKALFDLGQQTGELTKLGADIRSFAKAMNESAELGTALSNPAIRRADRKKVVEALLSLIGAVTTSRNFVYLLLDGERLSWLPAISRAVDTMIEVKAGRVNAEIVSAKPLDAGQLSQITTALEKISGKRVTIAKREDPELLGGIVARVGDTVYDGSLRTQLRMIRDELSK